MGLKTLTKQLRDLDVLGAPLLLQAASSSNLACFKAVAEVICQTLGLDELRLQLLAKDLTNRTILFYAATSKKVNLFDEVVKMLKKDMRYRGKEDAGDCSWLAIEKNTELVKPSESQQIIGNKIVSLDDRGMSVLHHACQAGSEDVLRRVLEEASKLKIVGEYLHTSDKRGRNALLHVLRAYDKPRENRFIMNTLRAEKISERSDRDLLSEMKQKVTSSKLDLLMKHITAEGSPRGNAWIQLTAAVQPMDNSRNTNTSSSTREVDGSRSEARSMPDAERRGQSNKGNKTALMLAAHGGFDQLNVFRSILFKKAPKDKIRDDGGLDLDHALGTTDVEGRGNLLSEAAYNGDKRILEYVVNAIQVRTLFAFSLVPRLRSVR